MTCDGKNHNWKKIYEEELTICRLNVVRWCRDCGAVVVDIDYDNRTSPGQIMKIQFPKITQERVRK